MMTISQFTPKTVYVTYIASTPEKVWEALTDRRSRSSTSSASRSTSSRETGGSFFLRMPDGRVHVSGKVVDWSPPRRFACTWLVDGMEEFRELPECLVTYDIEQARRRGEAHHDEAHQWDVPERSLSGGRAGWPAILSSLKSVLETGKPLRSGWSRRRR